MKMKSEKSLKKKGKDFQVTLSEGLWSQMDDANKIHYSNFEAEDLYDALMGLVYGHQLVKVKDLRKAKVISDNQHDTLTAMLMSPDYENRELAKDLIQVITEKNGNTI